MATPQRIILSEAQSWLSGNAVKIDTLLIYIKLDDTQEKNAHSEEKT
jgi:hypothetical protein